MGRFNTLGGMLRNTLMRMRNAETQQLLLGKLLAGRSRAVGAIEDFSSVEFSVFSQWGDDGVIQWLVAHIPFRSRTFVEFGVEDYRESTTRFLMMNDNWSGLVMDGSERNVRRIVDSEYYWMHDLTANAAFIDAGNIDSLISNAGFRGPLGILHIDLDGNDFWIWKAISAVDADVVIVEYNSVFGGDRPISVPYDPTFFRTRAHYSNLYWGASLPALAHLASEKGYALIGCTSAGNNAYFVRRGLLNEVVREKSVADAYVESKSRESRDPRGRLTYLRGAQRLEAIAGLPVTNVVTGAQELL